MAKLLDENALSAVKTYVDNGFLPLSGGTLSGALTITPTSSSSANTGLQVNNSILKISNYGSTVSIGSLNTGFFHFQNSANVPYYFNRTTSIDGGLNIYNTNWHLGNDGELSANTVKIATKATMQYNSTDDCIEFVFA